MRGAGYGLGLRTTHYADFLAAKQPLDWLEIITDNYLVDGGRPLLTLDAIRRDYPVAMHGVAMSLGASGGPSDDYLRRVKALADRIQPMWVSDHLCWIGPGPEGAQPQLHDLYPLPYTDEAARHLITQIGRAQDLLRRRLVIENVSSYIEFRHSAASEWQFLRYVAEQADCLLLVDVNNIHVSSVNHGFDPLDYLDGLPARRVQQFHLAGHADHGDCIVDTHDHPVAAAVWSLYRAARQRFGDVATMIERDDHIPPLADLLAELDIARRLAAEPVVEAARRPAAAVPLPHAGAAGLAPRQALPAPGDHAWALSQTLCQLADYVLDDSRPVDPADRPVPLIAQPLDHPIARQVRAERAGAPLDVARRLGIYHNAYRSRLAEVLADSFGKTCLYMGSTRFDAVARAFAVAQPPRARSLSRYGDGFAAHLRALYPDHPELFELARLDWDLRTRFDVANVAALGAEDAAADSTQTWLLRSAPLHPSVRAREITTNAAAIWSAIDDDLEVPPPVRLPAPALLLVWRAGLQPCFRSLEGGQAHFYRLLSQGHGIAAAAEQLQGTAELPDPATLGAWLREAWSEGLLAATS